MLPKRLWTSKPEKKLMVSNKLIHKGTNTSCNIDKEVKILEEIRK